MKLIANSQEDELIGYKTYRKNEVDYMKQLTNYNRVTQYLNKVFKTINEEYFNNELELPTITIQSTVGAYGHVSLQKIWDNNEVSTHELNLSADYLNRPIENIVATLIHEACHLYAIANNIKDTSNNGIYHNRRFKELAEQRTLDITKHEKYGWTITEPTEETIEFCINNSLEDIQIVRHSSYSIGGLGGAKAGNGSNGTSTPRKPKGSNSRKYICPCCKQTVRATKIANLICGDCMIKMVEEE